MKVIKHDLPQYDELRLFILSDCHWEDKGCNHKMLYKWRDEVLSNDNNYVIVNGDIINAATRNSVSDVYSATSDPDQALDEVSEFLEPIKDRILAVVDGNHEARIYKESGIKPLKRLAREIGLAHLYVDDAYLLFLSFGKSLGREDRKMVYSIYGRHGSGGGKKSGGKVNSLVDMESTIDADVYMMGHTHQPFAVKKCFYRCNYRNKKASLTEKLFVNANAFLNYGGYGEIQGFSPASLSWPVVTFNGTVRDMTARI